MLWLCVLRRADDHPRVAVPAGGVRRRRLRLHRHSPTYVDALQKYWPQIVRSLLYAGTATVAALLIAYPLAYAIAFKAGRWKNIMLVLVVAPFFTSFLIRTLAWQTILSDTGPVTQSSRRCCTSPTCCRPCT